ncbi:hypothetical protein V2J09_017560 [Rumex salicifolius]
MIFPRRKYELKQFMHSDNYENDNEADSKYSKGVNLAHNKKNAISGHRRRKKSGEGISSKQSLIEPGMIEFIGLIHVKVLRGTHLAIRDVVSSDPYVIISLGQQSVRTHVIKNNLNPVWNEKLMLSIPQNIPPLKLRVYDKDTFSMDDSMGKAEINIVPLVTTAKAFERSRVDGSKQLELTNLESTISIVDDIVKQELSVRLQNVESGILDLELECFPLTQ